ncbi:hypothetical protein ACIP5Y_24735 [Nocardia sp. NPDC088792]|uniref:hypothetical protein n=1 Tax=Nocardia sp. NPDC088792 TaxID=3364332 RepID=UPI0038223818
MTLEAGRLLVTRRLRIQDSDVHVTIGVPRRNGPTGEEHYCCDIVLDGLERGGLVRLQAISPHVGQALEIALSAVTDRLGVGVGEFLAHAQLG